MTEKRIHLTEEELESCRVFAEKSALQQQEKEYSDWRTNPRSKREIAHDNLIGKIAEVAFQKMLLEDRGIFIPLDFNYYPRGKWDSQDAVYPPENGWRIDVKGTQNGKWMLIEWGKLRFRAREGKLSHLYVMFSVGWDKNRDRPNGEATYRGFATLARLSKDFPKTETLYRECPLPETKLEALQTDNYGIRFSDLYSYLPDLYELLLERRPFPEMTDLYVCPPETDR